MKPKGRPETSVTNYKSAMRNIQEYRRSHLHRCENLKKFVLSKVETICLI
jgi:hypothetical protein